MTDHEPSPRRIRMAPSVRIKVGPRQGFLFDERTGRVYSLSATSALAATRLCEDAVVDDVVRAVVEAFDVDEKTALHDLAGFIDQLVQEGLARPLDGPGEHASATRSRR